MPIYEYACKKCGHEFEHLVRMGEKPSCPSCGADRLAKKFSVPAAHTAGSSDPPCSPREAGVCCDPTGCCGQGCNLSDLR